MTIVPRAPFNEGEMLTALCVWREARGEHYDGKRGVFCVLRNRCRMSPAEGFRPTLQENILKPKAFSSFNSDDVNHEKYPELTDPAWLDCLAAVRDRSDYDPTDGAVFYFSKPVTVPPEAWGNIRVSAVIGGLTFCAMAHTRVVT